VRLFIKDFLLKPEETIDYHIQSSWHCIARMYNQIASQFGFSRAIGYVLLNVSDDGTPATKIAPMLGMEPTSLSRMLRSMEDKGLIYRKGDDSDKRKVLIYLTKEGHRIRDISSLVVKGFNEKVFEKVDRKAFESLVNISSNINAIIDEYKEEAIITLENINDK
jgi:DNA-binding MarR family transcriptional regulator